MSLVNVTFFTKYARSGASSRYRSFQYLPSLKDSSICTVVSPLFGDDYLSHKYAYGRTRFIDVIKAFAHRLWSVLTVAHGSVVVVEYELLPFFPALLEHWLVRRGCRMIVDYDDALFHQYDQHSSLWVRHLLGNKIATVMRLANIVVTGNAYLANYALQAGAQKVVIIPTVVDLLRYPKTRHVSQSEVLTIGWIGSPSTARYLLDVAPALAEVCKDGRASVRLIGSGLIDLPGVPVEVIDWCDETEVEEICRFDVGIMPLPDEPWARGKCGFKLIQYMACGLPVIASPVGVNSEIVCDGVNGFLADTIDAWVQALLKLQKNSELQYQMGQAGRQRVEEQYCLAVTAPKVVELIKECAA